MTAKFNAKESANSALGTRHEASTVGNQKPKSSAQKQPKQLKRYNLVLPEDLYTQVQDIADKRGTTVLDVFRQFIKLGLMAVALESQEDAVLLIRQGDKEREIVLI